MTNPSNSVRRRRRERGWSQDDLAQRAGISRPAVSAIEQLRLTPSVAAAMAIARALECTVEELFGSDQTSRTEAWAVEPTHACRYWRAEVGGQVWRFPVETTAVGQVAHDGVWNGKQKQIDDSRPADDILVVATCDPAIGLLAGEYARQTPFRLLPLTRSSHEALSLLRQGRVHAAGVHLATSRENSGNGPRVKEHCGSGHRLLRIGVWQEGIALASHLRFTTAQSALGSKLTWVGRQAGSGARQCLDQLLDGRRPPRHIAPDHQSVATAIRWGWADAGVCLRINSEEAGLGFVELRREAYDLCSSQSYDSDPRIRALTEVVQSSQYRRLLEDLPGYYTRTTGEISTC